MAEKKYQISCPWKGTTHDLNEREWYIYHRGVEAAINAAYTLKLDFDLINGDTENIPDFLKTSLLEIERYETENKWLSAIEKYGEKNKNG